MRTTIAATVAALRAESLSINQIARKLRVWWGTAKKRLEESTEHQS